MAVGCCKKIGALARHDLANPRRLIAGAQGSTRTYWAETPPRHKVLNGFVIVFGSAIAAGGFLSLQNYSGVQAQKEFQRPGKEVASFLINSIERHVSLLNETRIQFRSKKGAPSRWTFFNFAEKALPHHPGIQSLAWIPQVPPKQRVKYEKRAVKDGLYKFRILGPNGTQSPIKGNGGVHFPIYYIEPFSGNEAALGYDLATDPVALDVLRRARDLGGPVTSDLKAVDAGNGEKSGIVITIPVYRSEILPFTVEERRKDLTGFIRGVLRFDLLLDAYRSNLVMPTGFRVFLYSHGKNGEPRLRYENDQKRLGVPPPSFPKADEAADIHVSAKFGLAGQQWTMVLRPQSNWLANNVSGTAGAFVGFTLLLTALLLLHLVVTQARTRAIEQTVAERTASLRSEITQRTQIEKELRAAKEEAESANLAKSEFLAVMSHELRTPLNAVIGFAEMMTNELYGKLGHENYRQYSSFIRDSADHLLSLINDILDLSKIDADRYELRKEEVNLADVWGSVHDMLREWVAGSDLKLECDLDSSPYRILADARALRQILLNLLSNAIKFTPEGGAITVSSEVDRDGNFVLSVQDSGIGISDEDLAAVFEPFRQLDSSVAREHEGTGLGLPLTQRLTELHGARLEIDSTPGKGTTVKVIFTPDSVVLAEEAPAATRPEPKKKRTTTAKSKSEAAPQRRKRQTRARGAKNEEDAVVAAG